MEKYYSVYWLAIIWYIPSLLLYPMYMRYIWDIRGKFKMIDFIIGPLFCIGVGWFIIPHAIHWQRLHNDKKKQMEKE